MESGQVYEAGNGKEYDMLETERLLLRKWTEEDADSLFEYAKDPEVGPIAGWPPHRSREESLDVIRNVLNGRECYAICEKGNPKAIGAIELILNRHNDTENHDEECELGYWLGKPFWGRHKNGLSILRILQIIFQLVLYLNILSIDHRF